jgi:hypothetical protein
MMAAVRNLRFKEATKKDTECDVPKFCNDYVKEK